MNKAPDAYIAVKCQRCGAQFTSEERAEGHGCGKEYWGEP
jgi:DNA-directed RNA polymerase subunit RPC12/RpoP